jgi:Xaa-Pro aminopeptidase
LIVDTAERNADLRYALGFTTPDPIVCVVRGRKRYVVVPPTELNRVRQSGPRVHAFTPDDLRVKPSDRRRPGGIPLALLRCLRIRSVTVPASFPLAVARRLEQAGIRIATSEGSLFRKRAIKTRTELFSIGQCQRGAAAAMNAALLTMARAHPDGRGCLRLGRRRLTSETVRAVIHRTLIDRGLTGQGTIVAGGEQGADPHGVGEGPLQANEPVVIDIFPRHSRHGYWGDLTRTVVRGRASARVRKMYAAVRAAQAAALGRVKAGVAARAVHEAVVREFKRRGFRTGRTEGKPSGFIHGTGHGVGLEIHEAPSVSRGPGRLRVGHVITIEPGLYYPGTGGVRVEDTVVVTRRGWRRLARCRHVFEIRGCAGVGARGPEGDTIKERRRSLLR